MVAVPEGAKPAKRAWCPAAVDVHTPPGPPQPPYTATCATVVQDAEVTVVVCSVPELVDGKLTVFTSTSRKPAFAVSVRHSQTRTEPTQSPCDDEERSSRMTFAPLLAARSPVPAGSCVTRAPVFAH